MTRDVRLLGLDCGSTTTSAVVAAARLTTSALGRVEITQVAEIFRSELVFTPFDGDTIDVDRFERYLDTWLMEAGIAPAEIFGGGALVTGLAAQRANAAAIARLIESRMADALVATANDPCLESWLAFMGNCQAISKAHPQTPILNLDLGGGTTNLAIGLDGQVLSTGCLFAGARHFQFMPGTYRLTSLSPYAVDLLDHLHIERRVGETLADDEVATIVDFYVGLIEAAVDGNDVPLTTEIGKRHVQVPLDQVSCEQPAITFSGGVGQLIYEHLRGAAPQGLTPFGDLGVELAARIARSPLAARADTVIPAGLGRATALGLLQYGTEISGSTLYLPHPERLPLKNVPIVGALESATSDERLAQLLDLAARSEAAALWVDLPNPNLDELRQLAGRLAAVFAARPIAPDRTLLLLVPANLAKVLGGYATRWGTLEVNLVVIDEIVRRDAQFIRIGRMADSVVPLSLYGLSS